jgi:CHAT domain-containing protein/tetratricopeptide (TPR) repeat protein
MFCTSFLGALLGLALLLNPQPELQAHTTVTGTLTPGTTQKYTLKLDAGILAELVLQQGSTDLVVKVVPPEGEAILVDNRENGPEPILINAEVNGTYLLEISARRQLLTGASYQLEAGEFHSRTDKDVLRVEAQRLATAAKMLDSAKPPKNAEAIEDCGKAVMLWRQAGDSDSEAATLVQRGAYYMESGNLEAARADLLSSLDLARAASDQWIQAIALNNLGVLLWQLGEFSEAIQCLDQTVRIWRGLGNSYGEAAALTNQGLWYRAVGSYQQALKNYWRALALLAKLGDRVHEANIRNNIGVAQHALAEDAQALKSLRQAVNLYHQAGNTASEGRAMVHIARIYNDSGQSRRAREYLEKALSIVQAEGDYRSIGDALVLLGEVTSVSRAKEKRMEAAQDFEKALIAYRKISNPVGEASVLHSMGVLQGQIGNPDKALDFLGQALAIRHSLGVRDDEAETLFQMSRVESSMGSLGEARTHIDQAIELAESVRALVVGPQLRMSYFSAKNKYYAFACDLYRRLEYQSPGAGFAALGFAVAERSRARSLLDLVSETNTGAGANSGMLLRKRKLQQDLNYFSGKIKDLANRNDRQALEAMVHRLDNTLTEYYQLESDIRDADPNYALLSPRPVGVAEVQKELLDAQTVMFEYSLGPQHSTLWIVTPSTIKLVTLPGRKIIERAVSSLLESLKSSHGPAGNVNAAETLANMVLPESMPKKGKRIIIVGDGVLQRVPFTALPAPGSKTPLIEDHEIVLLPSASVLVAERAALQERKPGPGVVAVIADPVFDAGDARNQKPVSGIKPVFARLPYTHREAETILNLVPRAKSLSALAFAAEKPLFTSGRLAQYRMVHIATHTLVDVVRPEFSALVFSMVDKKGSARDGYLRLHEIASLHLPAELVTLSACGTGLGRDVRGEGTVGVARGFIHAGARTVVVSLWDVEDESAAELMRLFYDGMLGPRHLHPSAALREAQRAMLESGRWPASHWGGWLVMGDWR